MNSICALRPGEIGEVYGRKTLAIPPILSIQMLFLDSFLDSESVTSLRQCRIFSMDHAARRAAAGIP